VLREISGTFSVRLAGQPLRAFVCPTIATKRADGIKRGSALRQPLQAATIARYDPGHAGATVTAWGRLPAQLHGGGVRMNRHVCPWWGGYFIDNRFRRWLHQPERILSPYVRPGMTVMDFGCGMGMFAIGMARLVGDQGQVIAVDLQQRMLDVLLRRATRAGVAERIRTHRCEADSIGLDDAIDFALAFYSAHEVPDLRRLLLEIHTRLRPEGRMLVIEPVGHVKANDFDTMVSVAETVGFKADEHPRICLSRAVVLQKTCVTC
jgi:SAM-dependent methyltransferase